MNAADHQQHGVVTFRLRHRLRPAFSVFLGSLGLIIPVIAVVDPSQVNAKLIICAIVLIAAAAFFALPAFVTRRVFIDDTHIRIEPSGATFQLSDIMSIDEHWWRHGPLIETKADVVQAGVGWIPGFLFHNEGKATFSVGSRDAERFDRTLREKLAFRATHEQVDPATS